MEFRAFVKNKKLVGISQRDCTVSYPFLNSNEEIPFTDENKIEQKMPLNQIIQKQILSLFNRMVKSDFEFQDKYTFDIFIDIKPRFKPRLIDIN